MKNEYFIWIVDEKTSMTNSEPLAPDSKGFGFVVTVPMEKHPDGFELALCLKAESELSAVKMFRKYVDGHSLISTHCMKSGSAIMGIFMWSMNAGQPHECLLFELYV